ncbi:MAG: glycosyltransferase [Candidatus Hydrogenedentes bacterium]|nr:glycosyltransferase [Candidatus Hydrogenedentota bacterium]
MARFSVVIPAYNEEKFLPRTIASIRRAEAALGEKVEIIVSDNLSTDRTKEVARELGAMVVDEHVRCISAVRNRGARAATGEILVFVDADDSMSENMLVEVRSIMDSGRYVGGGARNTAYDRKSLGITTTHGLLQFRLWVEGISLFLFFTRKETFDAIGGYNVNMKVGEDYEIAVRLRRHGEARGKKFANVTTATLVKSSRKFNEYGDWATFRHPIMAIKAILNRPDAIHEIWYKARRESPAAEQFDTHESQRVSPDSILGKGAKPGYAECTPSAPSRVSVERE